MARTLVVSLAMAVAAGRAPMRYRNEHQGAAQTVLRTVLRPRSA